MQATEVRKVLSAAAADGADAFATTRDRGFSGEREGQYAFDLTTDDAILPILDAAGFGVLSEEAGLVNGDREVVVVVDPLDGSTNASKRLPWYCISLCAVDVDGAWVSVVVDLANEQRFDAIRGGGARRNGEPLTRGNAPSLDRAVIGISGLPPEPLGWWQFRCYGAVALDLCAVASGSLDGYVDCSVDAHGVWDYLGAALICAEAGVPVADALGRDLLVLDHATRRTPVAGADGPMLEALLANRARALGS